MSNLIDALTTPAPDPDQCKVGRWLDTLNDDERDALANALTARPVYTVHAQLARAGHQPCSPSVWGRHWSGICCCTTTSL